MYNMQSGYFAGSRIRAWLSALSSIASGTARRSVREGRARASILREVARPETQYARTGITAWVLLDSINQAFTERVVKAAPGGAGGGGATLTAFGAEVLERYRPSNASRGLLKWLARTRVCPDRLLRRDRRAEDRCHTAPAARRA